MEIDLIDDIWQQVFIKFGVDRVRLATVCKRWASIILNPRNWRTFEANLSDRRRGGFGASRRNDSVKIESVEPFITKYCIGLADCHLTLDSDTNGASSFNVNLLNVLLQIKTLRRLHFNLIFNGFGSRAVEVAGNQLVVPQCKNLVLLKLTNVAITNQEDLQRLLFGLPNIEELYLDQDFTSPEVFAPAQKLKLLSVINDVLNSTSESELQKLSDMIPSLRYLLYRATRTFGGTPLSTPFTVGNMMCIPDTALQVQMDLEKCKKLGSFASPSLKPLLLIEALQYRCSKEVVQYLVNERKYDVNYTHSGEYLYTEENTRSVFDQGANYPLKAALSDSKGTFGSARVRSNPEVVEELLKLGANPNSPLSSDSPLHYCQDAVTFLLLVKYGANPNMLVYGYPAAWSPLLYQKFVDPEIALKGVIDMIDINAVYNNQSMLSIAINNHRHSVPLVRLLMEAGVQWNSDAVNALFTKMPQMAFELASSQKVDLRMLDTSVVFECLERGMLDVFRDHLKTLVEDKDEPNLSPMHYAALLFTGEEYSNRITPKNRKEEKLLKIIHHIGKRGQPLDTKSGSSATEKPITPKTSFGSDQLSDKGFSKKTEPKVTSQNSSAFGSNQTTSHLTSKDTSSFGTSLSGFGSPVLASNSVTFGSIFGSAKVESSGFGTFNTKDNKEPDQYTPKKLDSIDEIIPLLNCSINETTSDGTTPLLLLCKWVVSGEEKLKSTASLIKHGANVNLADKHGWTPLHAALYVGDWKLASLLLEHGANINAQDEKGITPLMTLIYGFRHIPQLQKENNDHFESEWSKLMTLCDVDLTLVDRSFNRSLVHLMASIGCPSMFECAEQKILKSELINARDIEGFTPLHYAVMFDNIEMVRYLLDHGADANAQTMLLKITPAMMLAIQCNKRTSYLNYYNILLLGRCACSQLPTNVSKTLVEPPWLRSKGEHSFDREDIENFDEMMNLLLSRSNLALVDDDGNTILHHLVKLIGRNECEVVHEMIELIRLNTAFKANWKTKNNESQTAANLFICEMCSIDTKGLNIASLLEKDAMQLIREHEIEFTNEDPLILSLLLKTPLHSSLKLALISRLDLSRTKYVAQQITEWRAGPLFDLLACPIYNAELVKAVLDAYPDSINETTLDGTTPLIYYIIQVLRSGLGRQNVRNVITVIDVLLAAPGAALNAQDQHGNTALHYTCKYFHTGIIDAIDANLVSAECEAAAVHCLLAFKLVEAGALVDVENKRGQTPLDLTPKLMQHYQVVYPIVKSKLLEAEPAKTSVRDPKVN